MLTSLRICSTQITPAGDVYADRRYPSAGHEATLLRLAGWRVLIQRKGSANKPISDTQKQRSRRIANLQPMLRK